MCFTSKLLTGFMLSNFSIYKFSDTEVIYLEISFFKVLTNYSATTDFPSLCVEYIFI